MKLFTTLIYILFYAVPLLAQQNATSTSNRSIDSIAVYLLDHTVKVISELQSCSYQVKTSVDEVHPEYGLHKEFSAYEVYMSGTDKMFVLEEGYDGKWGHWYNGKTLTYYAYHEDNYAIMDAPPSMVAMMDTLHRTFGIEFPAADFFYPGLTDDILHDYDTLRYLGRKRIDEQDCYHILARNESMSIQIWLADDGFTLPTKFAIVYHDQKGSPQYEATLSDWRLNPILPSALFEFVPPSDARLIAIMPKTTH